MFYYVWWLIELLQEHEENKGLKQNNQPSAVTHLPYAHVLLSGRQNVRFPPHQMSES